MATISSNYKHIALALIIAFLAWYFSDIFIFICISVVISLIGRPLMQLCQKVKFRNTSVSPTLAAVLSWFSLLALFSMFFLFLVPLIIEQANLISAIDVNLVSKYYNHFFSDLYAFLERYELVSEGQSMTSFFELKLKQVLSIISFSNIFNHFISTTGSLFLAVSIVIFLSFFFIKEPDIIKKSILSISPNNIEHQVIKILSHSKRLLTRYFIGLLIELLSMMAIISGTLSILGVHNAMLIGFLGGLMNIIPYLGPIIGATIGLIIGVIYVLAFGLFDQLSFVIISIVTTFSIANLIDNFVLQPIIYSRSVKAHPIEIFLVIIMAGKVAGVVGMIAAIPTYTVLKVIINQFRGTEKVEEAIQANIETDNSENRSFSKT